MNISYALSPDVNPDNWILEILPTGGVPTPATKAGTDKTHQFDSLTPCTEHTVTVSSKVTGGDVECVSVTNSEVKYTGKTNVLYPRERLPWKYKKFLRSCFVIFS